MRQLPKNNGASSSAITKNCTESARLHRPVARAGKGDQRQSRRTGTPVSGRFPLRHLGFVTESVDQLEAGLKARPAATKWPGNCATMRRSGEPHEDPRAAVAHSIAAGAAGARAAAGRDDEIGFMNTVRSEERREKREERREKREVKPCRIRLDSCLPSDGRWPPR